MENRDPSGTRFPGGRRYRALSAHLRERFGGPVYKVPVDAGLSCPNRDGSNGTGGCIYCDNSSFSPARASLPVRRQIAEGMASGRPGVNQFIAYFQSFSNTHGPLERLRSLFDEALSCPGVVGLAIATRPDCLPEPVLDHLATLSRQYPLWLELGLQSACDFTLEQINRGHTAADFEAAAIRCRRAGIEICAHLILGLPGEGPREMAQSAGLLARLGVEGVKLHLLHVVRGTELERRYLQGRVPLMGPRQYVHQVCDLLEILPPEMVIHRLQADCPRALLVAPAWMNRKSSILNAIDRTLEDRNSWQGKLFSVRTAVPIKR